MLRTLVTLHDHPNAGADTLVDELCVDRVNMSVEWLFDLVLSISFIIETCFPDPLRSFLT